MVGYSILLLLGYSLLLLLVIPSCSSRLLIPVSLLDRHSRSTTVHILLGCVPHPGSWVGVPHKVRMLGFLAPTNS